MKAIFEQENGTIGVLIPAPRYMATLKGTEEEKILKIINKKYPVGVRFKIVEDDVIPSDRTFREAWVFKDDDFHVSLTKSKLIAHGKRREKRNKEFAPLDIKSTIPAESEQAESDRQKIRDKYSVMQSDIDAVEDVEGVKKIIENII